MSIFEDQLAAIRRVCPGATLVTEAGQEFISLPGLRIASDGGIIERDALLTLQAHGGYISRLFLSDRIPNRGDNWSEHAVLGRKWHTPSYNHVSVGEPVEMLANHVRPYR